MHISDFDDEEMVSPAVAAQIIPFGPVHFRTIYERIRAGSLPAFRDKNVTKGPIFIKVGDLKKFASLQKVVASDDRTHIDEFDDDEFVSTATAARIVPGGPVHYRTVHDWIKGGRLTAERDPNVSRGPYFIKVAELKQIKRTTSGSTGA